MTTPDQKRPDLHNCAREHWGKDMGDALMEFLPSHGWQELATRHDLVMLESSLRTEMLSLRTEMSTGFSRVHESINRLATSIEDTNRRITRFQNMLVGTLVPLCLAYAGALWQLK